MMAASSLLAGILQLGQNQASETLIFPAVLQNQRRKLLFIGPLHQLLYGDLWRLLRFGPILPCTRLEGKQDRHRVLAHRAPVIGTIAGPVLHFSVFRKVKLDLIGIFFTAEHLGCHMAAVQLDVFHLPGAVIVLSASQNCRIDFVQETLYSDFQGHLFHLRAYAFPYRI